ncbi:MAG: hypothetical protein C3F02_02780 [Parcubacteria group bacterium]|nr:MAG: hypothetical protein C3F02_02780 [Parcubacteria group bacterium]
MDIKTTLYIIEKRRGNNYAKMIDMVAFGLTNGGTKTALILEETAQALEKAQTNPTKENWENLKKSLINNPPRDI